MPSNPVLIDRYTRRPIAPMTVQAADGRPLSLGDLEWVDRSEVEGLDKKAEAAA
jgi:hypothetical protein